ncbi:hypothetical protein [Clostridium minihomine]|nr:hypothetical protein [Clostridium minihomine]
MPDKKKKKEKVSNHTLIVRIVALVCAVLMAGSVLTAAFYL